MKVTILYTPQCPSNLYFVEAIRGMVAHLTRNLEQFRPYCRIEVGAFPRDVDFHPAWVYQEAGFQVAEDRGEALVLTIRVPP